MSKSDGSRARQMPRFRSQFALTRSSVCGIVLAVLAALVWAPLTARAQAEAASAPETSAPPAPATSPAAAALTPTAPPPTVAAPPSWQGLGLAQKWALEPLERDWDALDPARKSKWLEIAARFPSLPPEERNRMHERMRAWARLSPAERQQARLGYQVVQQIKAGERQAKWEAYQALSPEQRKELAEKAARKQNPKPRGGNAALDKPESTSLTKSNLVPPQPKLAPVKPVAPSVLQAKPGATTVLITQTGSPPKHQQAGQTKVFADPDLVDSKTLLPKRHVLAAAMPR